MTVGLQSPTLEVMHRHRWASCVSANLRAVIELHRPDKLHHALPLCRIRQPRARGVEVVAHMFHAVGARNYEIDFFAGRHVFQKELAPARRVKFCRPLGHLLAGHGLEQGGAGAIAAAR